MDEFVTTQKHSLLKEGENEEFAAVCLSGKANENSHTRHMPITLKLGLSAEQIAPSFEQPNSLRPLADNHTHSNKAQRH